MPLVQLIALLSAPLLELLRGWTRKNPTASDDEVKAEIERLVESDADAGAEYILLKSDLAAAKARLAGADQ